MKGYMRERVRIAALLVLCAGLCLISGPSDANAELYQLLSRYQHIEGTAAVSGVEWYFEYDEDGHLITYPHDYSDGFFRTSTTSDLSADVEVWPAYASAASSLGPYSGGFGAWVSAESRSDAYAGHWGYWDGVASALSELSIVFATTGVSRWEFLVSVEKGAVALTDLTSGSVLFSSGGAFAVALYPQHMYELDLRASGEGYSYVDVGAYAVPEAETIYLILLALISMMALRSYCKVHR